MRKDKNIKNIGTSLVLTVATMATLTSCATTRDVERTQRAAMPVIDERMDAARTVTRPSSSFVVKDGFYAASNPIEEFSTSPTAPLPQPFFRNADLNKWSEVSVSEIAAHVTHISGYRVSISPDVVTEGASSMPEISYKGNLAGLLDNALGSMNLSWRWTGDKIEIFRYETKMFKLHALAGTTENSSALDTSSKSTSSGGGGGSTSGNEGSSGSRTNISSSFDVWGDVTNVIKGVLSEKGTLTVASSGGIISVRDTPMVLAQVETQVREFNKIFGRQVKLNVEVYAVENKAGDNYGTDFNIAWKAASEKLGLGFTSAGAGGTGTGPGLSGIIPSFLSDGITPNKSKFAGSTGVFQALSSIGKTTLLTSAPINSLNGQTTPMNISTEMAYLESYSTTLTSGDAGNSTTTLTPGVVNGGFAMNVQPQILENNKVMVRLAVDLSSIDNIETFAAPDGNSAIQLPTKSVRNFLQTVAVNSGETLVLTGFQQTMDSADNAGVGSAKNWLTGGRRNSEKTVKTIVIVVTPYVVE